MIKIYNNKLKKSILIDDSLPFVNFAPREYEIENPHVRIKLSGINFNQHSHSCDDCKAFLNSFGTPTIDWFITYMGKTFRLNLQEFGSSYFDNHSKGGTFDYFHGTEFKFNLDTDTVEELTTQLEHEIKFENYERCILIRDKITGLNDGC